MEVDLIFQIAGIGIIVAVLNLLLKRAERDEQAMMVTLAGVIIVLAIVFNMVSEFFGVIKDFLSF